MSEELPEGWAGACLGDVCTKPQYGYTASAKAGQAGPRFLRITDIQDGRVDWSRVPTCEIDTGDSARFALAPGDIVFARSGATTGKSYLIADCPPAVFASYLIKVRAGPSLLPQYLHLWFQSPAYWSYVADNVAGNAQPNCNASKLEKLAVPIPPLAEQRRIVAKVEALLEQVRRAKDRLDRVSLILRQFRQSVLAAACSGHLTEGWRASQRRTGTGSASDRLRTLEAKRRELWDRRASDRGWSKRKYPEPFDPAPPDDVEIPEGWAWASVSALTLLDVGFAFPSRGFKDSGVRLLRGENIAPGTLRWSDTKCWPASDLAPHQHLLVEPGEIILGMDRPLVAAGLKIARAKASDLPALLVQRVMRFKMADPKDTDYLFLCLSEKRFIEFLAHDGMTGSDLPHITGTGVAEFSVPLPPADEQAEIVRRVDRLFALATAIERRVELAAVRADSLPQAILSKAFAGELVPTEAELARAEGRAYETAEQLLARVRAHSADSATGTHSTSPSRRRGSRTPSSR